MNTAISLDLSNKCNADLDRYPPLFEQRRSRCSIDSHWYVREEWAFLV